ncbi:MAG: phosphoserine aminotransferase, partial [Rhodobacteraceae bacterium]|nr:phosphoserine aminotransferase [Paracoccaceae bacterium]
GVAVPDGAFISPERSGLTLCDATSAAFVVDLPWDRLDVTTFSWQKVLGSEAAHGVLILSPRAVQRLQTHTPSWPIPKIFRLAKNGHPIEGIFSGATINTPSMLCVEDVLHSLHWARDQGGVAGLGQRAADNVAMIDAFVSRNDWIEHLAVDPATRSPTSVCLRIRPPEHDSDQSAAIAKLMTTRLAEMGVAYDIGSYRAAPPGLRIWCGATVETADIAALLPWIEYAYHDALSA